MSSSSSSSSSSNVSLTAQPVPPQRWTHEWSKTTNGNFVDYGRRFHLVNDCFENNVAPVSLRILLETDISAKSRNKPDETGKSNPLGDDRNLGIRCFWGSTLGAAGSLAVRIARIVLKVGLSPFSTVYQLYKGNRYGIDNQVKEHWKKIGDDFVDFFVTIATVFMGIAKTFKSDAFGNSLEKLRNYYFTRIDERMAHSTYVAACIKQYEANVKAAEEKRFADYEQYHGKPPGFLAKIFL